MLCGRPVTGRLPADAAAHVVAILGTAGAAWLARLPRLIEDAAAQWQLVQVGEPFPGAQARFVAPAITHDGRSVVLKIAPEPRWLRHEASALRHWAGRGAVRLEAADADHGALLLQRAVPGHPLTQLVLAGDDENATRIAAGVLATMREHASPPPAGLPTIESWVACLELPARADRPRALAEACLAAQPIARGLLSSADTRMLLHGDLHHENVLSAGDDRWLAIDPKGIIGPPEADTAALLRNPRSFLLAHDDAAAAVRERLRLFETLLQYDRKRTAGWGFVAAVIAAAWACEDREGEAEVRRWLACAAIIREAGGIAA